MTKTQTKSRRVPVYRRPITIIIAIILIVAIAIAIVAFFLLRPTKTEEATTSSTLNTSSSSTDSNNSTAVENPPDKAIQFEGENPNELEELTGSITRRSISSGELTVVASIDQFLSSDSNCRLVLKDSSGQEVRSTDSLPVTAEATSSACGPFTVPVNQLSGTYTIDVIITSPDKSGHITAEINL